LPGIDKIHALLERIAKKDEAALRELYYELESRLRRFVRRRLETLPNDIDDVLQDTFIAIWRGAGGSTEKSESWVRGIAKNISNKRLDKAGHPMQDIDDIAEDLVSDTEDQATTLEWHESILRACIEKLPPVLRECFRLVYIEALPQDEVAKVLQIPVGTVKSRLSKGRELVTQCVRRALGENQ